MLLRITDSGMLESYVENSTMQQLLLPACSSPAALGIYTLWEQTCCWCQEQAREIGQGRHSSMNPTTTKRHLLAMEEEWHRIAHQNPNSGRATLLMSQSSRVAWRGLQPLYPIPYKQTMAKTLLQDKEARSLTSSSSIIYYLLGAGVTPTCSSGNETRKPQALLNLFFFLWLNKDEAWLWPPFFFLQSVSLV